MAKQANLRPVDNEIDIAPVTVGNPSAAADLAIDQSHLEEYASADRSPP